MARANKRIKVGDTVKVLNRAHDVLDADGKELVRAAGKVLRIDRKHDRVFVEGVNIIKRHRRGDRPGAGEIQEREGSIHLSNVMLIDDEGNGTRVGVRSDDQGRRRRVSKRSGNQLD